MRKLSTLIGVLAMSAASLQASGMAAGKNPGQRSADGSTGSCSVGCMSTFDQDKDEYTVSGSYVGGAIRPANTVGASSGSYSSATQYAVAGEAFEAPTSWTSGVNAIFKKSSGQTSLGAQISYFANEDGSDKTYKATDGYTGMTPTTSTDSFNGASAEISQAKLAYALKRQLDASLFFDTELINQCDLTAYARLSTDLKSRDHSSFADYRMDASAKKWQHNRAQEILLHGGTGAEIIFEKSFGDSFTFYGQVGMKVFTGKTEQYYSTKQFDTDNAADEGYLYFAESAPMTSFMENTADIAFLYKKTTCESGTFTFRAGLKGSVETASTSLFSSMGGAGSLRTQDMVTSLLHVGIDWSK